MLKIDALRVVRGRRVVLDAVDVAVPGPLTVLMGPNGAGKSSLMMALAGVLPATGVATLDGEPLLPQGRRTADHKVGFAPQSVSWPGRATPQVICEAAAYLRRVPRAARAEAVDRAIELSGCADLRTTPFGRLSGGQRRRVALAQALVHSPDLLLLDEPTAELDPRSAVAVADLLGELVRQCHVVVSTHAIDDAVRWGGDLVVMDSGRAPELVPLAPYAHDLGERRAALEALLIGDRHA